MPTHLVIVVPLLIASHKVAHLNVYLRLGRALSNVQTQVILKHNLIHISEAKFLQCGRGCCITISRYILAASGLRAWGDEVN